MRLLPQRYSPENVPISVFVVEARSLSECRDRDLGENILGYEVSEQVDKFGKVFPPHGENVRSPVDHFFLVEEGQEAFKAVAYCRVLLQAQFVEQATIPRPARIVIPAPKRTVSVIRA